MRKTFHYLITFSILVLAATDSNAQAWQKDTRILSLGMGASQFYHLDGYYNDGTPVAHDWYAPVTGQMNFQGEFGIHKYVGLGFTTSMGGRGSLPNDYKGELNMPMGMLANFHFYQLISDKTGKNIHADKLDIYAGASMGGGIAITYYTHTTRVVPMAFGGLHAGVRYYFVPKVGINGELGWGKSIVNMGFVFKISKRVP